MPVVASSASGYSVPTDNLGYPSRMWWKPFVTLIWLGGLLIAFGGLLSLLGRVDRDLFNWLRYFKRKEAAA